MCLYLYLYLCLSLCLCLSHTLTPLPSTHFNTKHKQVHVTVQESEELTFGFLLDEAAQLLRIQEPQL